MRSTVRLAGMSIALLLLLRICFWVLPWAFMESYSQWLVLRDQLRDKEKIVEYLDTETHKGNPPS